MGETYTIWEQIGIKRELYSKLVAIFSEQESIEKVVVYGSRATNEYKKNSDIDLCIYTNDLSIKPSSKVRQQIEELGTALEFDIVIYSEVSKEKLVENIDRDGVVIYEKGGRFSLKKRMLERFDDYKNALSRLDESLKVESPDDLQIDGIIQRFEFNYELAWKVMKDFIEYTGGDEGEMIVAPRPVIKKAFKIGLISDGDLWIKMVEDRNETSHGYDEEISRNIYQNIRKLYIKALKELGAKIEKYISEENS